jgi:hypothetical protein
MAKTKTKAQPRTWADTPGTYIAGRANINRAGADLLSTGVREEDGRPSGVLYGFKKDSGWWAGTLLVTHFGCSEEKAKLILSMWRKNGTIEVTTYDHPIQRKKREGILVNADKRPGLVSSE